MEKAPKDMFFSVMLHPSLDMKHPLVKFVSRRKNAEIMWFDIPAIGLKRDIKFFLKRRKLKCDLFHCLYSNHPLFLKGVQMVTIHDLKYVLHPEFMGSKGKLKSIYVDTPVSLYAATKKADELMAHVYSQMYGLPTVGLRFFTVYGPYGRPDMAYFKFADRIERGQEIEVYNNGQMKRDFTYIDDVTAGIEKVLTASYADKPKYRIYNIGRGKPENLMDFIHLIEKGLISL